jgi:hypothetical protein
MVLINSRYFSIAKEASQYLSLTGCSVNGNNKDLKLIKIFLLLDKFSGPNNGCRFPRLQSNLKFSCSSESNVKDANGII